MRSPLFVLLLSLALQSALPSALAEVPQPPTQGAEDIGTLKRLISEAMNQGDWPRTVTLAERILALEPQNAIGHRWLGLALTQMGDIPRALPPRQRATELQPDDANNWNGLCWTLILANQPGNAQSACEKAVRLDPADLNALINLGHTFLLQGDIQTAMSWYQKALPYIHSESELKDGPLADFDIFISKGWQVEASRITRAWFEKQGNDWLKRKAPADKMLENILAAEEAKDFARSVTLREQRLPLLVALYGENHPRLDQAREALTDTRDQLANQIFAQGRYGTALPIYLQVLAAREAKEGADSPKTAISLNDVARCQDKSGALVEAEALYRRALGITAQALGPDHAKVGTYLNNLAGLLWNAGRYGEAEPLYRRALAITEKALGPDHAEVGICLDNLANLLQTTGRYSEAEPLYRRALIIAEHALGSNHAEVGTHLNNLAVLLKATGRGGEAAPLYRRALGITEQALGPDHPDVGNRLNNLASQLQSTGRYSEAEPLYRRALAITEKALGPDHTEVGNRLNNLAGLLVSTGSYVEAAPLYRRALAIAEKALGPDHADVGTPLNNLALLLRATDRYGEVESLLLRAWHIASNSGEPEVAWTIQDNLRALYTDTQPDLAIWYGKQAVNTLQAVRAGNTGLDKETQKSFLEENEATYKSLADLLFAQGRLTEGQQVLAMLKEAEYFDFVQRSSTSDPRKTQAGFTEQERPWSERYNQISHQLAALGKEREGLLKRLKHGETLSADELARKEKIESDLAIARQAYDAFMVDLKREFTQSAAADRQQEFGEKNLASLRALQGTLRDLGHGAVTLHYLMTDKRLWILLPTPTVQLKREATINAADLNRQIGQYREAIARRDPKVRELGKALYDLLIAPVADDLQQAGAQTLMLSLDGSLRYLPMAALYDGEQFLAQRYQLALYTSAAKDKLKDKPQTSWSLAGYGLTRKVEDFNALPSVKNELEGILQGMPGQVKFDQAFTAQAFKSGLENEPPVVHLASHFVFAPGNETDSFLLLGDGKRLSLKEIKDGYEFVNLDLLTLSACETAVGGGKDANGREVEGFGALAQNQGAKGVMATLWPVADESTGQFMQLFYGIRQKNPGMTKAEAMQKAQLAFIEGRVGAALAEVSRGAKRTGGSTANAAVNTTDHPYFWAPFILMGNWL